jgi:P-aminobenzoate N-oxygenase AurF
MTYQATLSEEPTTSVASDHAWRTMLGRLNRLSVTRHFDAYADIDWDSEHLRLDSEDPRWELNGLEPLAVTDWYRSQAPQVRARLGCDLTVSKMKLGLEFESVLKRGLLEYATTLDNGAPEFRYAYHEVIEEAQHSLMFQEFVNRSGFDAHGMRWFEKIAGRWIAQLGRRFPPLFFMFVLGGEDPIDHVQRRALREADDLHPLMERIMKIHTTEEARHLSFARHYLRRTVPELGWLPRATLAVGGTTHPCQHGKIDACPFFPGRGSVPDPQSGHRRRLLAQCRTPY